MKKTRISTKWRILDPVESSLQPTVIRVMKHPGTGSYQWWGDDAHPYSLPNNSLSVVINVATTTKLTKI